mmetsp:Transcript_64855/g.189781  ORF Transcript_64855/g.189781 Transcript_64855/m.189781 type:complete len:83 (-) Transcript_64855:222-470(-)
MGKGPGQQYTGLRAGGFHDVLNSKHDEHLGRTTLLLGLAVANLVVLLLVGAGVFWIIRNQERMMQCQSCSECISRLNTSSLR